MRRDSRTGAETSQAAERTAKALDEGGVSDTQSRGSWLSADSNNRDGGYKSHRRRI
jgi:hypothetical protein